MGVLREKENSRRLSLIFLLIIFFKDDAAAWIRTLPPQAKPKNEGVTTLAIDYGLVKTGLATGRCGGLARPQPLTILRPATFPALLGYIRTYQAQQVVLGWPLHKNGTMANQTHLTEAFGMELKAEIVKEFGPHVPVFVWDERYTSQAASANLYTRSEGGQDVDAEAACIILQSFFQDEGDLLTLELDNDVQAQCIELYKAKALALEEERKAKIAQREAALERRKQEKEASRQQEIIQRDVNQSSTAGKKKKKKKKKRRRR